MCTSLYNYADNNTLSCSQSDCGVLKTQFEDGTHLPLNGFIKTKWRQTSHNFSLLFSKIMPLIMILSSLYKTKSWNPSQWLNSYKSQSMTKCLFINIFLSYVSKLHAKQMLLRRIAKFISNECRLDLCNAFIPLNINYCSIVWHFCISRSTHKIEKNQQEGKIFLYSATWEIDVALSRLKSIALEIMRCVKMSIYMNKLFMYPEVPYDIHGGVKLIQPKVNTIGFGINPFSYQGANYGISYQNM